MYRRWLLLAPVLFGMDRVIKIWAHRSLLPLPGSAMEWIPGIARLRYVENPGAAFSLFSGQPYLLIGATFLILLALLVFLLRGKGLSLPAYLSLTAALAGGLGNLYDRVAYGRVIDYVELLPVRFAIFNLADVFVCGGALLFAVFFVLAERPERTRRGVDDSGSV